MRGWAPWDHLPDKWWQAIRTWGSRSDARMWTVITGIWVCAAFTIAAPIAALFVIGVLP